MNILNKLSGVKDRSDERAVHPKVLVIVHNAKVPSAGGRRLNDVLGWNDPAPLINGYIADLKKISDGYVNYNVVDTILVDGFPVKEDGYNYKADDFVKFWREKKGFHQPDWMDYNKLVNEFDLTERVNQDKVDEVWMFGFPYAGYYESRMVGKDPFWCNAPGLEDRKAKRRYVIMGYNYQRGVGEMLENLGHRAESIIKYTFRDKKGKDNLWEKFSRYEDTHPGQAEVGTMHFAPNSQKDYDWGNTRSVTSRCDTWLNFPNLSGEAKKVTCKNWGDGDIRKHHQWWFERIPHVTGDTAGISNNWWQYIIDPERVR
jgi:hypothetical protein